MDAILYRFRAELRTRWKAWIGLAIIVGLVAGAVMLLVAGARRTSSAYDRFRSAQNAYDVGLVVQCQRSSAAPGVFVQPIDAPGNTPEDESCIRDVADLPAVGTSTMVIDYPGYVETHDGVSVNPDRRDACFSGAGEVHLTADPRGRFGSTLNVSRLVAGRRAVPTEANEAVVSENIADRLGLEPGDRLRVQRFAGADCEDEAYKWGDARSIRVVGVGRTPGEIPTPSGFFLASINLTPAFARETGIARDATRFLMVRLHDGATVASLKREARQVGAAILPAVSGGEQEAQLSDTIRPTAVSLAVIAALVAIAGVVVLGQIVVRQTYLDASDRATLAALGLPPSQQFALAMLRVGFIGAVGACAAAMAAIAGSPSMPRGVARSVEPAAGVSVDPLVIGAGIAGTLLFVLLVAALPAWLLARRGTQAREARDRRSRSSVATALARAGAPPMPVAGVRYALDRGAGVGGVPVWSSLAGLVVAVTTLVGALTFGVGLTHLLDTPRLTGWNWDVVVGYPALEDTAEPGTTDRRTDRIAARLRSFPEIEAISPGTFYPPFRDGLHLGPARIQAEMSAFGPGGVGPSVIAGRAPRGPGEILLGPQTLAALGLEIGDRVDAIGQAGTWEEPTGETVARMRIVGTGILGNNSDFGEGASMTLDGLKRLNERTGADSFFVRRAAGVDDSALAGALGRPVSSMADIKGPGTLDPSRNLLDLKEVDDVPALLGALMAAMAAAVLAHLLVSSIGQHRRDLALLRTLGCTRVQVSRAVGWQATAYALITVAVSVPLGIGLGRMIWSGYAESIGVVPEPLTPWTPVVAVAVAAFVIANLIALVPARRATRAAPAAILRTE